MTRAWDAGARVTAGALPPAAAPGTRRGPAGAETSSPPATTARTVFLARAAILVPPPRFASVGGWLRATAAACVDRGSSDFTTEVTEATEKTESEFPAQPK